MFRTAFHCISRKLILTFVATERVRSVEDGEVLDLGLGRPLEFIHTRGHAKHHFVVHDTMSKRYKVG